MSSGRELWQRRVAASCDLSAQCLHDPADVSARVPDAPFLRDDRCDFTSRPRIATGGFSQREAQLGQLLRVQSGAATVTLFSEQRFGAAGFGAFRPLADRSRAYTEHTRNL